jgi:hydrogenase nickel incorporation protein HypB
MKQIQAKTRVLSANDRQALKNLHLLRDRQLRAVNILASPGAGKTSFIERLLKGLPARCKTGVIEGDVASSIDTDRIRALGFPAIQINTDGGCHLDAVMVARAIGELGVYGPGYLFIENIGNLICPAGFELGESIRIVVASVPEGDDKPIKYPGIFATAGAIVLNKIDLLGHVDFRMPFFLEGVQAVNDKAPVFNISCRSGEGVEAVIDWLVAQ